MAPAIPSHKDRQLDSIARLIDHTLLAPDATPEDVRRVCAEAREHRFRTVCINPCHVGLARDELAGSGVDVGTVVGFPLGAGCSRAKAAEAAAAVEHGADELDMVMSIGLLRAGDTMAVVDDIEAVVKEAAGRTVKVIIETCLLTDEQKAQAVGLIREAGASFVKTSTGFSKGGATVEDVRLLARAAAGALGVKASGGIRDLATAREMVEAGATRIGTSSGVKIVEEEKQFRKEE